MIKYGQVVKIILPDHHFGVKILYFDRYLFYIEVKYT